MASTNKNEDISNIILPAICICLGLLITYKIWVTYDGMTIRVGAIIGLIITIAIIYKYLSFTNAFEGFEVIIPAEESDTEEPEQTIKSANYDKDGNNRYIDKDEEVKLEGRDKNNTSSGKIKTISELDELGKTSIDIKQRTHDKFTGVSDANKTIGPNSFNPQIIINNPPGNGSNKFNAVNTNPNPSSGPGKVVGLGELQENINHINSSSNVNTSISYNLQHNAYSSGGANGMIDEYLKPKDDIFNIDFNNDPFQLMAEYLNKHGAGGADSGNNANCSSSKPYSEEQRGKFNSATLTNRTYVPGMSYMPPMNWSVPQYHPTACRQVCNNTMVDTRALPIGIMDHGTPVYALEIGSDGTIAKTEQEVRLTNVGSMLPKFEYREYIECPAPPSTTRPTTTTTTTTPTTTKSPTTTLKILKSYDPS